MLKLFKNTWRRMDEYKKLTRVYHLLIGVLLIVLYLQHNNLNQALTTQQIYLTPQLIQSGGFTKANILPKEVIYNFAFTKFTELNSWRGNENKTDYQDAIQTNRYFVTPSYYQELLRDFTKKRTTGELNRLRVLSGYHGEDFSNSDVRPLGNNAWEVNLVLRLEERLGDTVVKDVLINYPIKVVKIQTSQQLNPYGLAIDGYVTSPKRIKTLI